MDNYDSGLTGAAAAGFAFGSDIVRLMPTSPLDPNREIYPKAPLKLVAFEIRYSASPRLESDHWEPVFERLREELPILTPPPRHELQIGPDGPRERARGRRFMNRARTCSATLFDESATLEASAYVRFEDFSGLARRLLVAIDECAGIPSVQRLGLRYIDEIQVPGFDPAAVSDWSRYIAAQLLEPTRDRHEVVDFRVGVGLRIHDDHQVGFRYGRLEEPVVDPEGPLKIIDSPTGPYFLLDFDSFWTAPENEFPPFEIDAVEERLLELHAPIRELFESSITDDYRAHMRGK